ncbi:signal recognition particle 54 kDa protein 2 [Perkinsus marinus ATCC 50983]|uniref:signal-recognition-particle GTPase n=1 Tax=Perkinsus marinus (strain ATCC 50983 / TXsc) TaxID=423536 RepID=C5LF52_PERM5|nr:signal recognition particle 54 kDa protein 2 [Perkinsus marinus ATCC 50983]EER04636.1 signal recognition particle 54 kDa protein 2 [Perkinsus marinus ATCC 50983]|eukprot:XP_002772820.1 signal recognition particle 54 kDa protein 2 [Perkinsus marinus ATCC 50983]
MVLNDLSSQLTSALRSLQKAASSLNEEDDEPLEECLKEIAKALLQADVNVKYVSKLRQSIRTQMKLYEGAAINRHKTVRKLVFDELVKLLTPSRAPRTLTKGRSNVVMFVGLQGSGKTTSCTKYALYYQRRGWKVALVCADTFRAGAFDQLRQNATKALIPFYGSHTITDPVQVASEGVELFKEERYDLIIVDTSGRHKQELALFDEMKQVRQWGSGEADDVIFVMDSHIGQACSAQAAAFSNAVDVGSVIITKLDGHAKGGGALSAVAATDSPIIFIGTGEHLDDFERFEVKGFVGRLLGMGDLAGLADSIANAVDIDEQKKTMERLQAGKAFTLRDLYSQLQAVMNMGSMSKMLSMLPGMGGSSLPTMSDEASVKRIKRFLVMMDSLTAAEMDSAKPITEGTRIMRISRGSGSHPYAVIELIEEHKKMQKMLQRMGKTGLLSKAGDLTNMVRNPQQVISKLKASVDHDTLAKMGGAENFFSMMKEMEQNEEMQALSKKLSSGSKKR